MKLLAVLVNCGTEQLNYLERVVRALKSFEKYDVDVIVNSNIPLNIEGIKQVNILKLKNNQLLPLTCRRVIYDLRREYDIFLYGENDHLFQEHHIDQYVEHTRILPEDRIAGLIQYEENKKGDKHYPAYHGHYHWANDSVEEYSGKKFAHFTNLHQACFILTQQQLDKICSKYDFTRFFSSQAKYSVKCRVNTDIYQFCGMKKMICISDFEKNLIHHLPNLYINGDKNRKKFGYSAEKMAENVCRLLL